MEKSNKRGKIPQSDWPSIMARYEAGETLSSIARTYDCSPPAISYVVSRSRARHPSAASPPPTGAQPQLLKAAAAEAATGGANPQAGAAPAPAAPPDRPEAVHERVHQDDRKPWPQAVATGAGERREAPRLREANGFAANGAAGRVGGAPMPPPTAAPQAAVGSGNGDARPRLHLSLGTAPSGGGAPPGAAQPAERPNVAGYGQSSGLPAATERSTPPANRDSHGDPRAWEAEAHGRPEALSREAGPVGHDGQMRPGNGDGSERRGGGSFIDKELRARVAGDIAAFLAAFDAALEEDTQQNRSLLREATDRLLRAGARTRIELERLEARVPLAPRDAGRRGEPAWRQR